MAFYLSPQIAVLEQDLTSTIQAVATSIAQIVVRFPYKGSEKQVINITNDDDLIDRFGAPTNVAANYEDMLAAVGYLEYGSDLKVTAVRPSDATFAGLASDITTASASATFTKLVSTGAAAFTLDDFTSEDPDDFANEVNPAGPMDFICLWRGNSGNNIRVAVIDSTEYNKIARLRSYDAYCNSTPASANDEWKNIIETVLSLDSPIENNGKDFLVIVEELPKGKQDVLSEWNIVETWNVSTDQTALDDQGRTKFAESRINTESNYIRIALKETQKDADLTCTTRAWQDFGGGYDGDTASNVDTEIMDALDLYENPTEIDINIFIDSNKSETIKSYINDICVSRKDCMGILDCKYTHVVNNKGNEVSDFRKWRLGLTPYIANNLNLNSDKVAVYVNWLEVYDRWNKKYRWIPASGHVAGIFANTDNINDPWFAPAGLNRGILKGIRRTAWNPNLSERDQIYKVAGNPIVSFAGKGKVVWGQKTMLDKNSAFNRINVRRLFLIMEKAIATSAEYVLFEPNDPRTRMQIIDMINPFLRDVQARRGIYDFLVICDERNNTPERIDRNELWADIMVKPVRAAEFIVLRFTATKTGVSFEEVTGTL